jgi:hypothetical protein
VYSWLYFFYHGEHGEHGEEHGIKTLRRKELLTAFTFDMILWKYPKVHSILDLLLPPWLMSFDITRGKAGIGVN